MSVRKIKWKTKSQEREGWLVDYRDQTGKRRSKLFKRKKDADEYQATAKVEVMGRIHVAGRDVTTVAEAGKLWLEAAASKLEKTTVSQRRQHLHLHIEPFLGRMKLNEITVPVISTFLDHLEAGDPSLPADDARRAKRSSAMVAAVRTSLGSLLAFATQKGLCTRNVVRDMARDYRPTNGARHVERIRVGVDVPTIAEVNAILAHAQGAAKVFMTTAALTGMRASELRGLAWDDVNFDKSEIHVRRRADADNQMGSPKTKAGRRTIPIGRKLVAALREWKLACPKGEKNLVFPRANGNVIWHANMIEQWVHPPQIAAGVAVKTGMDKDGRPIFAPKYTGLHAFRHFYASFCINAVEAGGLGLSSKEVQQRLGHSSITMTLDVYGHLFPRGDASDLDRAETALLGA